MTPGFSLEEVAPADPRVAVLYADFINEADEPLGIDLEAEIAAGPAADLVPPTGRLLLGLVDGEPAALGGVRHLDTAVAEVKNMYVAPQHRGAGLAATMLAELERIAREHDCRAVRLDTSDYLTAAIALYRSAGYEDVADYNGNRKASVWMERALTDQPISLVPYDPAWPAAFEQERGALAAAIGDRAAGGIHHVGSTAVPGLAAKPTIDILVGVEDLRSSRACFEALAGLDYLYAPYRSNEMHWFCKPDTARRTHHLHLVPISGRRFTEELDFREFLRADSEAAAAYEELKRELADRFADDREAYTEAKAPFIREALERAQL